MSNINFAFFGTSNFSIITLNELEKNSFLPKLIVTTEDKPAKRGLEITPPRVKIWAKEHGIPFLQFKTLRSEEVISELKSLSPFDFFVVASYGKIIPKNILELPKYGTLNIHPSLLPKLRGASPTQSAILKENETGVTIIKLDEEMDHGPILAQEKLEVEWPPYAEDLEKISAEKGARMLCEIMPQIIAGSVLEKEQDHQLATYTEKIEKKDGEIKLEDDPEYNLRKIRAFHNTIGTYFFKKINEIEKRIIVKRARMEDGKLVIERIVPEGKKEMDYNDFLKGIR